MPLWNPYLKYIRNRLTAKMTSLFVPTPPPRTCSTTSRSGAARGSRSSWCTSSSNRSGYLSYVNCHLSPISSHLSPIIWLGGVQGDGGHQGGERERHIGGEQPPGQPKGPGPPPPPPSPHQVSKRFLFSILILVYVFFIYFPGLFVQTNILLEISQI